MPSPHERRPARPTLDKLWLFRNHPVFGQLAPDQIEHLCSYAQTRRVTRGTTIFKKGDPGNSLFAIAAGTVKIDVPSAGGRQAVFSLDNALGEQIFSALPSGSGSRSGHSLKSHSCH